MDNKTYTDSELEGALQQYRSAHQQQEAPGQLRDKLMVDYRQQFVSTDAPASGWNWRWRRVGMWSIAFGALCSCALLLLQPLLQQPASNRLQAGINQPLRLADATTVLSRLGSRINDPIISTSARYRLSPSPTRPKHWPTLASLTSVTAATKNRLDSHKRDNHPLEKQP